MKAHLKHFDCEQARIKGKDQKICAECQAEISTTAPLNRGVTGSTGQAIEEEED